MEEVPKIYKGTLISVLIHLDREQQDLRIKQLEKIIM